MLWLFVILLGLDLGAGLYETRVVVPLWTGGVPATLAESNPYGGVAAAAGMRFWAMVSPLLAIVTVLALVTGLRVPQPQFGWRLAATIIELVVVAATLVYFAPTAKRLLMTHGAGMSADAIASIVRMWVALSWGRVALSAIAWLAGLMALTRPN